VIVVDASAAVSALLDDGPARRALGSEQIHAPHLIDSEVSLGLRKGVPAHRLDADSGWTALDAWSIGDHPVPDLLTVDRAWELQDNLSAYDASYVALAELLDCNLLTADARLSRAPGSRCAITVVPR
jgi:predicted nucleic acid-binding protein